GLVSPSTISTPSIPRAQATRASPAAGSPGNERSAADLRYFHDCLQMWRGAREDISGRIDLGARALATPNPVPEETQVHEMRRRLALDGWPHWLVQVAAVDLCDGTVRFLKRADSVLVEVAVAASCAQPGLEAPVTVGSRRYMDGRIAGTSIDGAAGYRTV